LLVDDGITRVEVRGFINSLFDENGKALGCEEEM